MINPSPAFISPCESLPSGVVRRAVSTNPNALRSHDRAATPSSYEIMGTTEGVLLAGAGFRLAVRLRVVALLPAARRSGVVAAFLPAVRRFRVVAAFRVADAPIGQLHRCQESAGLADRSRMSAGALCGRCREVQQEIIARGSELHQHCAPRLLHLLVTQLPLSHYGSGVDLGLVL